MIIGISGKSGSGKTTLANQISTIIKKESVHLDIDKVGHKVLTKKEVFEELKKSFGEEIVKSNVINRKKLGELVFTSRNKMEKLNEITWKHMQIEIDSFLENNKNKVIILDWLLLPITKYFDQCDIKILLDIPYEIRKKRAMQRDNISEKAFDLRDNSSIDLNPAEFDYVLREINNEDIKRMVKKI